MQPEGDLWFSYVSTVDHKTLPPGVIIEGDLLINTTSEPLIIMNRTQEMWMLKSNKLLYEQQTGHGFIETDSSTGYGLVQNNGSVIDDELILDRPLENIRADNRPQNIALPASHTFKIETKYQNKTLIITGKIDYKINPNYDPKKLSNKLRNDKLKASLPIVLASSIALFIIYLIVRKRKVI